MLADVVAEADGWSVFIPGLPVAADGVTRDEALTEMVEALREYARDWHDHLSGAPNHQDNRGTVELIDRRDDEAVRAWLVG